MKKKILLGLLLAMLMIFLAACDQALPGGSKTLDPVSDIS